MEFDCTHGKPPCLHPPLLHLSRRGMCPERSHLRCLTDIFAPGKMPGKWPSSRLLVISITILRFRLNESIGGRWMVGNQPVATLARCEEEAKGWKQSRTSDLRTLNLL